MKHLNFKGHTRIKTTINVILLIKVKPAGNPGKVKKIRVMNMMDMMNGERGFRGDDSCASWGNVLGL